MLAQSGQYLEFNLKLVKKCQIDWVARSIALCDSRLNKGLALSRPRSYRLQPWPILVNKQILYSRIPDQFCNNSKLNKSPAPTRPRSYRLQPWPILGSKQTSYSICFKIDRIARSILCLQFD